MVGYIAMQRHTRFQELHRNITKIEDEKKNGKMGDLDHYSAIGPISPDFFLLKSRLREVKLLRLDRRLAGASW